MPVVAGMAGLGLIAYSLYLWHWPAVAYLNYVDVSSGLARAVGVLASAILLSWVSWNYIEVPFRRNGVKPSMP
jgi:peptidoglycan/LPS O-acetylase OafA/YrhL